MDNDAERKSMMSRPIPAKPKGAAPHWEGVLHDALRARGLEEKIPTSVQEQLDYTEIPKPPGSYFGEPDPFSCFSEIMLMLKKQPKPIQRKIIALIAELLTE